MNRLYLSVRTIGRNNTPTREKQSSNSWYRYKWMIVTSDTSCTTPEETSTTTAQPVQSLGEATLKQASGYIQKKDLLNQWSMTNSAGERRTLFKDTLTSIEKRLLELNILKQISEQSLAGYSISLYTRMTSVFWLIAREYTLWAGWNTYQQG